MLRPYFNFLFPNEDIREEFLNVMNKNYLEVFQNLPVIQVNFDVGYNDAVNFLKSSSNNREVFNETMNLIKQFETLAEKRSQTRTLAQAQIDAGDGNLRSLVARLKEVNRLYEVERINLETINQNRKKKRTDVWNIVYYGHYENR